MSDINQSAETNITFEEALQKLEKIVKAMEAGNIPLDLSLSMFEEGASLVKICTDKLDKAEQKVKMIVEKGGDLTVEEFPTQ